MQSLRRKSSDQQSHHVTCNQFNNERVKDANSNTKISAYFLESAFDYWHFFDDLVNQNILSFVMHFLYTSKVMFWKLWYLKKADLIILLTNLSQLSFAAPTNPILCLFTFVNILNGCFFVCNELKLAVHHLRCLTGISFNCWSPKY